ncbi:MAG: hypothetical protein JW702_02035 [Clostridiales bacterium]|nr:hypothetical protein [Clostridiales bacterium]
MTALKTLTGINNLLYLLVVAFPVILMVSRTDRWGKKYGKSFKFAPYAMTILVLMNLMWIWDLDRTTLTFIYVLLSLFPLFLLFDYQKKEYEPEFRWSEYLKSHKYVLVIFVLLIIAQLPLNRLIAKELLQAHHVWVGESLEIKDSFSSYNEAMLSNYEGEQREYLENYDESKMRIAVAGSEAIIFDEEWNGYHVSIHYELERGHWYIKHIFMINSEDFDVGM